MIRQILSSDGWYAWFASPNKGFGQSGLYSLPVVCFALTDPVEETSVPTSSQVEAMVEDAPGEIVPVATISEQMGLTRSERPSDQVLEALEKYDSG